MQRKLPDDVKRQCLAIVQGYDRRRKWYIEERQNILESTPSGYTTYTNDGVECRQYNQHISGRISDTPYDKTIQLERLEKHIKVQQNKAIDDAKLQIGVNLPELLRQKLVKAIMINCEEPRRYPYEYLGLDGIGRRDFYYRRTEFLYNIAVSLELV